MKKLPTVHELGQVALAAMHGNTEAVLWLLQRMNLEPALRKMGALDAERKGATVH